MQDDPLLVRVHTRLGVREPGFYLEAAATIASIASRMASLALVRLAAARSRTLQRIERRRVASLSPASFALSQFPSALAISVSAGGPASG